MDAVDDFFELDRDIDPQKICRLCLSQANTMYNVFAKSIVDGYMISLPKIFSYALDIHVRIVYAILFRHLLQKKKKKCKRSNAYVPIP